MISLIIQDFNKLNQIISSDELQLLYQRLINKSDYLTFECRKCGCNNWHIHAYYNRSITFYGYVYKITLTRVKCAHCGITHVILPCFIIPYQRNSIIDIFLDNVIRIKDVISLIISKVRDKSLVFLYPT